MTRAEHLAWCKQRALEYVDRGDLVGAFASMTSDLGKHPETASSQDLMVLGMPAYMSGDPRQMREFINGFN